MSHAKPLQMPPELTRYLGEFMSVNDVLAATLVTTDARPQDVRGLDATSKPLDVWISYIPCKRLWTAHRDGLGEITASSLPELQARLEAVCGGAEIRLHMSRGARVERARRKGLPLAVGWT